jgi:hypothetical protein
MPTSTHAGTRSDLSLVGYVRLLGPSYRPDVPRKRKVLEFSGAPTWDAAALQRSLVRATRAQVTFGGYLIYAVDPLQNVLDDETLKFVDVLGKDVVGFTGGAEDLAELVESLAAHEVTDSMCMCTGDLAVEFFDGTGELVEVVRIDLPSGIEWPNWPGRASLVDSSKLLAWLKKHSIAVSHR